MTRLRLFFNVFTLELRKIITYRFDFWIQFLGVGLGQVGIAYFLWSSIYGYLGTTEIKGITFPQMMFYYVLAPYVMRAMMLLQMGAIFQDIYDGGLNKYLIYPLSFFEFKYAQGLAYTVFYLLQLYLALFVFFLFFDLPASSHFSLVNLGLGSITLILAGTLFFWIAACIEMATFYVDNIWSLLVILRFFIGALGGGWLPLELYPDWLRPTIDLLPFSFLVSFPVRVMQGEVGFLDLSYGLIRGCLWILFFAWCARKIWQKGLHQYSGVGI